MQRWLASAAWALLLISAYAFGQDLQPIPELRARVTDVTATLSAAASQRLEERLSAFETVKGSQVAVLIVASTQPEEIEQYSLRVVEKWKLGRAKVDDGALLIVAKEDRRVRIEVGYGLEGALNDATSKRIIDEDIVPRFRSGDFAGGIEAGAERMMRVIEGEPLPSPRARPPGINANSLQTVLVIGLILVFVVGGILRAVVGPLPAAAIVGAIAGAVGWFMIGTLIVGGILTVVAFVLTLAGVGRGRGGLGSSSGGWSSGSGGFGSGGGFGGGGGGFGGGGASGRW